MKPRTVMLTCRIPRKLMNEVKRACKAEQHPLVPGIVRGNRTRTAVVIEALTRGLK